MYFSQRHSKPVMCVVWQTDITQRIQMGHVCCGTWGSHAGIAEEGNRLVYWAVTTIYHV